MATLAIAGGGAVLGGVAGGLVPGVGVLLGVQLGLLGGAILGNILFPGEIDTGGPSRDDVRLSSAATGRFIPIPYGVVRVGGQYIWVDEPLFKTQSETAGKGGGPEIKTTKMFLTFALGICEGPIAAVTRIWFDGTLVFDISENNPDGPSLSSRFAQSLIAKEIQPPPSTSFTDTTQAVNVNQFGPIRIYLGKDGQPPDPLMQLDPRIGEALGGGPGVSSADFVPPMNGLAWAMFDRVPGEATNNHFPQVEFEVLTAGAEVKQATEYEPVPSRARRNILPDRSTIVSVSPGSTSGQIHFWNTSEKNPTDPVRSPFIGSDGASPPTHSAKEIATPYNIGSWDDPDLLAPGFSGAGNSSWVTYSLKDGTQRSPSQTIGIAAVQPIGGWFYPDTFNPTHFIFAAETTDQLTVIPMSWEASDDLDAIRVTRGGVALPGTDIATTSYMIKPGFVGPDGLLYIVVGESNSSELAIAAFDPLTLNPERVCQPYRTSPASADPFYGSMAMTYDAQHDKIILISDGGEALRKVDRATLTIDPEPDLSLAVTEGDNYTFLQHGPYNGKLWLQRGSLGPSYQEVDVVTMTLGRSIDTTVSEYGISEAESEVGMYDPINNGLWVGAFFNTDWLAFLPLDRQSPVCPTAGEIAADISERCEVAAGLRDTAGWSRTICGYLIGRRISGRRALEPIAGAINGDFRTQDGKVQFFTLDGASVKTVPEADLGAAETVDAKVPARNVSWPYERELPARVDVQFVDRGMDFASNTAGFDRPLEGFRGRGKETVQMPIVFDGDSDPAPIEIAERLLYAFDANRQGHALALSWEHLDLNVGDAFEYVRGGFTHRVRVEKWSLAENNKILIEAKSEDVSINTPSGGAGHGGSFVFAPPALQGTAGSELFLIDAPLLRDVDDAVTGIPLYAGAAPAGTAGWPGANLMRSSDGGATWAVIAAFDGGQALDWGIATTALGDARPGVIDRTNALTLRMRRGTLGSVANADLDENRNLNALLVGRPGRWELIRFAEAANASGSPDEAGDTYTIRDLRRGLRGTNLNVGSHRAGDLAIVLDTAKLARIVLDSAELNVERLYRLVTIGQPEGLVPGRAFTLTGESKRPYTLSDVRGSRNAATGDWTVQATRRTRIGGGWVDFVEPPLGEASEAYEVDVLDGPGGAVVLTKAALGSPVAVLTAGELHAAGLGAGSPDADAVSPFTLTLKWYQLSATVGRGGSEEITLSAPTPGFP